MAFEPTDKVLRLASRLESFMERHVYPNEARFYREAEELGPWAVYPVVEELKPLARQEGLWNLFLPESEHGAGLTTSNTRRCARSWGGGARPRCSSAGRGSASGSAC
jgi:alkylation response protein AidB-like acyl-CoA dehydrogenase